MKCQVDNLSHPSAPFNGEVLWLSITLLKQLQFTHQFLQTVPWVFSVSSQLQEIMS